MAESATAVLTVILLPFQQRCIISLSLKLSDYQYANCLTLYDGNNILTLFIPCTLTEGFIHDTSQSTFDTIIESCMATTFFGVIYIVLRFRCW